MNQAASGNVQLKHPTGPWWVIAGTPGEIVQQIGQVFPHLTQNVGPTDFPAIVAQAAAEWAQIVGATGQTPNPGNQSFGGQNQGSSSNGFGNGGGNQGGGGFGGNQNANQGGGTPEPTHVQRPTCAHGEMLWKSGNRKADNKPYAFWTCQSNDRNNQCKPEFPPR